MFQVLFSKSDKVFKQQLKNTIGFKPSNVSLYKQAFRHSSSSETLTADLQSNERLEFLGDAVLGIVVAEYLFKLFPKKEEGFLTQMRSRIVNGQTLLFLSRKFGLDDLLESKLTKKEKLNSSAYSDVFEALIGAIYLDKGFEKTKEFILINVIKNHLDINKIIETDTDFKSQLQILMQRQKKQFEYKVLNDSQIKNGNYTVELLINGISQATFEHKSKKVAEQRVAQVVLEKFRN